MLEVENLTAGYGSARVLQGVSLSVRAGEYVGIVGPNGAGKSTLLRSVSRLTRILGGVIRYQGRVLNNLKPWDVVGLGICHVPEGRMIFADMTVGDNLLVALDSRKFSLRQRRDRLEYVTGLFPVLRERWSTRAGSLSGGQQQMLAVARGLVTDPRVLLLDEPSLGLAPVVIREIIGALRVLRGTGITVLVADQNASLLLGIVDRVYVMAEGGVKLEGTPTELRSQDAVWKAYLGGGS